MSTGLNWETRQRIDALSSANKRLMAEKKTLVERVAVLEGLVQGVSDDRDGYMERCAELELLETRYPVSETTLLVSFDAPIAQPKERHRKGAGGRMYTPEKTVAAEEAIGWAFKNAARGHRVDKESRFGLVIAVAGANAAADVDNLAKVVMDGLQGVLYRNDKQVDELHVRRLPGREKRTEVTVYRIEEG